MATARPDPAASPTVPVYGLDASLFDYLLEDDPELETAVARVFRLAAAGRCRLVTSVLVLVELLAIPKRGGEDRNADRYHELFRCSPNLTVLPVDLETVRAASDLRAAHGIGVPQAVLVATAVRAGADGFMTEDRALDVISELPVMSLADVLAQHADPAPTSSG